MHVDYYLLPCEVYSVFLWPSCAMSTEVCAPRLLPVTKNGVQCSSLVKMHCVAGWASFRHSAEAKAFYAMAILHVILVTILYMNICSALICNHLDIASKVKMIWFVLQKKEICLSIEVDQYRITGICNYGRQQVLPYEIDCEAKMQAGRPFLSYFDAWKSLNRQILRPFGEEEPDRVSMILGFPTLPSIAGLYMAGFNFYILLRSRIRWFATKNGLGIGFQILWIDFRFGCVYRKCFLHVGLAKELP